MKKIIFIFLLIFCLPIASFAQGLENYIIQNDIGDYKFRPKPTKEIYGNSGVVISADHFDEDHDDVSFVTQYIKPDPILGVDVQATQHTGGDSDRWLLHELDAEFRTYYGIPGKSYSPEQIDGKTILQDDVAGANYRWLSGNKVIEIKYRDSEMNKPEPLEVVKAYLAKHPSSITSFTLQELRHNANVTKWIKDEIDRRLWLCDKWNAQFQTGGVAQADLIYNLVRSMNVFLNYRQKYYGVAAADLTLLAGYQQNKDIASIQTKLSEYKGWWSSNKARSISLP